MAAFCLLPSLRSTPSPTTLETLQVGFKTPSGCEATIHGAHQWFHRHRGDLPRVLTLPIWRPAASRTLLILWAILKARRVTDPCQLGKSQCTDQLYEELLRPSKHQYFVRSPGPSTGGLGRDPPEDMIILGTSGSLRSVNRLETNLR